jgi:hypothetical protein
LNETFLFKVLALLDVDVVVVVHIVFKLVCEEEEYDVFDILSLLHYGKTWIDNPASQRK